jgi:two-component system, OmpR family, phosphate regulon response regulator PhoB
MAGMSGLDWSKADGPDHDARPAVLVVEDQPDLLRLVELTLSDLGVGLVGATSGDAAWELLQRLTPTVVILDVMLPGALDGLSLCRRIRAEPRLSQCCVILISARGQHDDIDRGRVAGATHYLVKPFDPMALREHVRHAIR